MSKESSPRKYTSLDTTDADIVDETHHLAPTDLYRNENIAIAMSYFAVGFVGSFISTPLNIYMVSTLNAEPPMQNTIGILQTLPWTLKLLFGFLSDSVPIFSMHRKPYLTMGAVIYSIAYMAYALMEKDSLILLAVCVFVGTLGLIELDVMADTMCVERSKFESNVHRGQMQASCYSIRFGGGLIGALLGASVCNQKVWGWGLTFHQVAFINGLIPFTLVLPFLYLLKEKYHMSIVHISPHNNDTVHASKDIEMANQINKVSTNESDKLVSKSGVAYQTFEISNPPLPEVRLQRLPSDDDSDGFDRVSLAADDDDRHETHPIYLQLQEIWETVQLKAVWRPMAFVYVFNLFQIPNVSWQSYLQLSLGFPAWVLGLTVTLGSFMTFAGILAYKYLFFKASWRSIYIWTSCLTGFFSFLQILLIFQVNVKYLHLSNYLFSLGDDVISAYINGIQFLPVCVMYMRLCPDGSEGASYAMLTTFSNIALVCASNLGNYFAGFWDVSNEAMRRHDISGLWRLSLLTSTLAILPLSLIWLLPKDPEDQENLARSKDKSRIGGIIFLVVLFGSLIWTISTAVDRLIHAAG